MKSNFINIYFSNSLLKWLDLILWIIKPIKLISRKYFISPLRDYKFHLENMGPFGNLTQHIFHISTHFFTNTYIKKSKIPYSNLVNKRALYVPSTLNATAQHTEILIMTYRSHSWYIKVTYTSWSGPLFSQNLELI